MNISIIGYGKMGRAVEQIAESRGHKIVEVIDYKENHKFDSENFLNSDVAIEFTLPDSVEQNISTALSKGVSIVSGTTGWSMDTNQYKNLCLENKAALLFASNFSIGVNIFFEINKKLAELMSNFQDYNGSIEETHHIHKIDKPSGTAVSLAKEIISKNNNYKEWALNDNGEKLPIFSKREGEVFGYHSVKWESEIDYIKIEHNAKSRKGFALGAVLAAEFIKNKIGVYTMKDLLNI